MIHSLMRASLSTAIATALLVVADPAAAHPGHGAPHLLHGIDVAVVGAALLAAAALAAVSGRRLRAARKNRS